jgi:hypothetical protein
MFANLRALVVVLGIALPLLMLLKPLCLRFMLPEDFARRRNVWIALTVTAFVSPSFWLYALIALALCAWAASKDSNPPALYLLLLQVIPPVGFYIPMVGINHLFMLDSYRILSLAILLPTAVRLMAHAPHEHGPPLRRWTDGLLLGYMALQLLLLMPYESYTNTLRRAFLLMLDVWLLYYVFSRACRQRDSIVDALAAFCLACALLAPIALFESLKGWLLYLGLGDVWAWNVQDFYLRRAETLRAQASVGHPLALGYMMAVGFGFALYLGGQLRSRAMAMLLGAWMWMGLFAAYSRGPWLVAVVAFFAYTALGPDGRTRFLKYALLATVLAVAVLVSPLGDRVIDNLPFVGTIDAQNVTYRQRLAQVSWQLIQQNPLLGNPFVLKYMEDLRQGQGIIDLVNTYASIALLYGLVGLSLFLGVFVVAIGAIHASLRTWRDIEPDTAMLGAVLVAAIVATLSMMAVGSFGTILAQMAWALAGLSAAFASLQYGSRPDPGTAVQAAWPSAASRTAFRPSIY